MFELYIHLSFPLKDESNTITLLHREKDDWQVMGNCATHRLVDLAFLSATDFVSIGEDRVCTNSRNLLLPNINSIRFLVPVNIVHGTVHHKHR